MGQECLKSAFCCRPRRERRGVSLSLKQAGWKRAACGVCAECKERSRCRTQNTPSCQLGFLLYSSNPKGFTEQTAVFNQRMDLSKLSGEAPACRCPRIRSAGNGSAKKAPNSDSLRCHSIPAPVVTIKKWELHQAGCFRSTFLSLPL